MLDCRDRLELVKERIKTAALSAGRSPEQITLIAVSKRQSKQQVAKLISVAHQDFGENTVQEAMAKVPNFPPPAARWHFVGHLQSNKAKIVPEYFDWVHSVDSVKLATKLSEASERIGRRINILLQVNITGDQNKSGVSTEGIYGLAAAVLSADLPGIRQRGLMTIGLRDADQAGLQRTFAAMKTLQESCAQRFGVAQFAELSMGMSGDYEVAIAEGATMVRIGTAIFGARV